MEEELASKQNDVDKLINTAIEKTRTEINTLASTKAINIAKSYIIQNIDYKQHEKLIDTSIDNILKVIKP